MRRRKLLAHLACALLAVVALRWQLSARASQSVAAFLGQHVPRLPRRTLLIQGGLHTVIGGAAVAAPALAQQSAPRLPVVDSYPSFGSLLPLYGVFELARSAAQAGSDASKLPAVRARFQKLTDQDLDAYRFLCTTYIAAIKYADPDEKLVGFDKASRFKACSDAMAAVGRVRDLLSKGDADATSIQREVSTVGANLAGFFALVPKADLERAQALSAQLKKLDANSDGRLSDDELLVKTGQDPLAPENADVVQSLSSIGLRDLLIP